MSTTETETKTSQLVKGLRELADFLESSNVVPMPSEVTATAYGSDAEIFVNLADMPNFKAGRCGMDMFQLKRDFTGHVSYRVVIGVETILPNPPMANVDDILRDARQRLKA